MRKILIINPNSSDKMTEDIRKTAENSLGQAAADVVSMPGAPEALECFGDYTIAGGEMLAYLQRHDVSGYGGILVACFGDPCLYAIKEAAGTPVIGIAEAAFSRAFLTGYRFSVIAANEKAVPMMENLIDQYGFQSRNAGTLTLRTNIADFLYDPEGLKEKLIQAIKQAAERGAETVIYGCAGMTMVSREELMRETGISIIDPVMAGISTLRAMVEDKDRISKTGLYGKKKA